MIPPHTKAIPLNRLPVVRKHGEALFLPAMVSEGSGPVAKSRRREGFRPARQGGAFPFRPARRPMPAVPAAALPPRSAPRSEHFARLEGKASETPRPGHFSRGRKVSVLRRTTWGGPASPRPGGMPVLPSGAQKAPGFASAGRCAVLLSGAQKTRASPRPGGVPVLPSGAQKARLRPGRAVCRAGERSAEGPRLRFGRAVCRAAERGAEGLALPRPGGVPVLPSGAQKAPASPWPAGVAVLPSGAQKTPGFASAGRCGRQLEFVSKSATIKA